MSLTSMLDRLNNDWCDTHCIHLVTAANEYKASGGDGDPISEVFDDVFDKHCTDCPVSDLITYHTSGCDAELGRNVKTLLDSIGWNEEE